MLSREGYTHDWPGTTYAFIQQSKDCRKAFADELLILFVS